MHPAARAIALIFPCALAGLAALTAVTGTDAAEPGSAPLAAPSAGASPAARQAVYAACRDQVQPSSAPDAQARRAQQHHRDAAGRSQRPAWVQQSEADIERCLHGGPDAALAAREPARYARR